jgi:hypothetical protein
MTHLKSLANNYPVMVVWSLLGAMYSAALLVATL